MEATAFEILGLEESANDFDIKKAFRREVRRCHPDAGGISEDFIQLQRAYSILKDEKLKSALGNKPLFSFFKKELIDLSVTYDRKGRVKSQGI